jgi:hypothetical protein
MEEEAALVNHRGRVIATNTPRRLVGTLWPGAERGWPPADGTRILRRSGMLWSVAVAQAGSG